MPWSPIIYDVSEKWVGGGRTEWFNFDETYKPEWLRLFSSRDRVLTEGQLNAFLKARKILHFWNYIYKISRKPYNKSNMGYVKRISWIFVVRFQKSGYFEIMDTSASELWQTMSQHNRFIENSQKIYGTGYIIGRSKTQHDASKTYLCDWERLKGIIFPLWSQ